MVKKPTISISCIATIKHLESIFAIENTLKALDICKIYWVSDIDFPKKMKCEVINIKAYFDPKISFNESYSYITLKVLPQIVDTDFNLIVQYDGYAVNKKAWTDRFLNYDYIGATWPYHHKGLRVGNGGFSLRSKRLYDVLKIVDIQYERSKLISTKNLEESLNDFDDKFVGKSVPEDIIISHLYRKDLEKHGVRFAPEKLADRFSIENNLRSAWAIKSFGFHGEKMLNYYNSVFPILTAHQGKSI